MTQFSDPPLFGDEKPTLAQVTELLRTLCSIDFEASPVPAERELQARAKLTVEAGLDACRRFFEQISPA